jgi:hypothetical protein
MRKKKEERGNKNRQSKLNAKLNSGPCERQDFSRFHCVHKGDKTLAGLTVHMRDKTLVGITVRLYIMEKNIFPHLWGGGEGYCPISFGGN